MLATVYVITGSHACRSTTLMLEHKRIPYRRVELPTGSRQLR
jgi:glutathione S-transferase